ncbi:MAG TPA: CusA/CzcA family heavy metal efflux RND transporter [Salinivirgaceae bacterium]|nr:CusA/CzcA family heavy metal efflux RND transporter [Salinivirgaceae bacterium]
MLDRIIGFSLKYKLIVILFTLTVVGFGIYAIFNIPVGAVPDITNNQVQVITTSNNLSTQEIEQFITAPVELEMANLPGVQEIRSVSKFGLSVVTIVFKESMGTYLPRTLIAEKIKSASAEIPEGFGTPEMGPITTGLGEIYQYVLDVKPGYEDRYTAMDLRTIQDWIVRRQLSGIDGVVEVNSWGGYLKEYEVAVNPARLQALDVTLLDVFEALENNNSISGGAYIEKKSESYFIRGDGQVKSIEDIENILVKNKGGIPVLVKDVAKVHFGYANRFGSITANGEGEKVLGQIMMLKDANSKKVINEVKERVAEVQKTLPEGVYINPILERSELISKTTTTVLENLIFGCIIVFFVVLLLLGNMRSALVIASMIPLSLLFTLSMMYVFGIDANLMSLGALDFGIIIDGAVIIVEYVVVRLTANQLQFRNASTEERLKLNDEITKDSASTMMKSAIFGQFIILIVFIPILSLQGVEGKMFRPMALAFSFAIIGAMIFCLTWLPVISSMFLRPVDVNKKNFSDKIVEFARKSYQPVLKWALNKKALVFTLSFLTLILSGLIFNRMGGEFIPTLDEGDFVIQPVLKTGTSLSKTIELTTQMENILMDNFPEVEKVVCRIGAAEVPTDPMSMEEIDMIIRLKPKKTWKSAKTKEALAEKFKEALSVIPGIDYEFTQPIEMRFNELITGVRADIAVKIFGEDLDYLSHKGEEIKELVEKIDGAGDVILEKTTGLPQMNVTYNRSRIAYYGVDIKTLNSYLSAAFGGEVAGSVFEGERRFDLVLRLQQADRVDIDNIRKLPVLLPNGSQVPLSELANIHYTTGPAKISRENTRRCVVVGVNVRNRDLQSVANDIQAAVDKNVKLNPGYYVNYGGQFENLQNASKRLTFAVPIALALIFIFLHFAFKSLKDTIMIFTAVPLSVVGGIVALWIRGMPFSISAGVGFIALFGVAVLNGIVLIEHLKDLQKSGMTNMDELVMKGTVDRLRPVFLTASAAAMGFLPMAISTGAGAEVQRPLATVVIGGLITSTMLTMIVLPLLFKIFHDDEGLKYKIVRKFKLKNFIIPLFLAISGTLSAQSPVYTLEQCVDSALKNNKEIGAYNLKIEERKALAKPFMTLDKTQVYYGYDQANVADNGYPLHTIGVDQSFLFPTVHAYMNRMEDIEVNIAEQELQKQQLMLTKNVSSAYYSVQFLQEKQFYFQRLDSLYVRLNSISETQLRLGDISQLDKLNAQAKRQQISLEISKMSVEIQNAYSNLKAMMQTDEDFRVAEDGMKMVVVNKPDFQNSPEIQQYRLRSEYLKTSTKAEQHQLLPDISLGYFYGNNRYENSRSYHGFQVGLGIPLFGGDKRSKIKASRVAFNANELLLQNNLIFLETKYKNLLSDLQKLNETIEFYNNTGKQLSDEIIRTATRSYEAGEIDFYEFAVSMENALKLTLEYYEAVLEYNRVALELNYLTIENP